MKHTDSRQTTHSCNWDPRKETYQYQNMNMFRIYPLNIYHILDEFMETFKMEMPDQMSANTKIK